MKQLTVFICISLLTTTLHAQPDSMLATGSRAPDFTLVAQNGDTVSLSSFRDKAAVVLIFYPGDETPVCTQQLCELRDSYDAFADRGAVIFGINPANAKSHTAFSSKNNLQFPLLIDADKKVAKLYGTYAKMMQKRTVYVVGQDGTIIFARRGKPAVSEILAALPAPAPLDLPLELNSPGD